MESTRAKIPLLPIVNRIDYLTGNEQLLKIFEGKIVILDVDK